MREIWKSVEGYERYYMVSNYGRVKSLSRKVKRGKNGYVYTKEKILKQTPNTNGYLRVFLCVNKKRKTKYVHRLVAKMFLGDQMCEERIQVNHKDGVKTNNHVDNLEWCSHEENLEHAFENKLIKHGEESHLSKLKKKDLVLIEAMRSEGRTMEEIASVFDVHRTTIGRVLNDVTWKRTERVQLSLIKNKGVEADDVRTRERHIG